jgi:hypothetical protein
LNIPKHILICGRNYKIIKDKKIDGGNFNCGKQEIRIGTRKGTTKDELSIAFLHEIVECILAERLLRYKLGYNVPQNGDYLFNFNHKDFENWICDLNLALKDIIG